MFAEIECKTNMPDLHITYFELQDDAGNKVDVDYDSYDWGYNKSTQTYTASWRSVSLNGDETNDEERIKRLNGLRVSDIGFDWDGDVAEPFVKDFCFAIVLYDGNWQVQASVEFKVSDALLIRYGK